MEITNIAAIRIISQQLEGTKFKSPAEIVNWMGAMQAQDFQMAKWGIGIRLPGISEEAVTNAIDSGEIIRTHLLRPTWHLVSARDVRWMLELTAPRIKSSLKTRHKQLELTEDVLVKSASVLEKALEGKSLTRKELTDIFLNEGIAVDDNRLSHLLLQAELDGLICSGVSKEKLSAYALLDERVPAARPLNKDEALASLAKKYFSSHGPVSLQDFVWWSGLSLTEARHALEMVKSEFISEKAGTQIYWLSNSFFMPSVNKSVHLLPAFDEFLISYKDRNAVLTTENQAKAFSKNGIFWPVILINGKGAGLWKRTVKKDKVMVELQPFNPLNRTEKGLIEKAAAAFGHFLKREAEVV